jgi:diguanylate cyclase (GGDEF)-like protein
VSSIERFPVTAEVVSAITSSHVLDEVLASVARRTAEVLDLWECDIYEYRPAENATVALALWATEPHPADAEWVGSSQDLDEQPIFRRVLTEQRTLANHIDDPDLPAADRSRMEFWGEKSCLLVPLIFKGEVIGCLELVEKRRLRAFTADEEELASTLAALAAVAIQNARLYSRVEQLAITDGLTGLYNHRHFFERLAGEVARANRYQLPLSLLMIDIDDFKSYNDAYGHLAGDALLRALAVVLQTQTRQQVDLVARYGGEEFAIILPSTPSEGGLRAGERLRDVVNGGGLGQENSLGAPAPEGSRADPGSSPGPAPRVGERIRHTVETATFGSAQTPPIITVSIGVASLHGELATVDGLVEAADRALYRAKQLGKNQVAVA